jgi:hypothetical protein
MSTPTVVMSRFAQATRLKQATVKFMLRTLRHAGLVPAGEPGAGTTRGHYEPEHLASLLLALVAAYPSDAAEESDVLGRLVFGGAVIDGQWVPQDKTKAVVPAADLRHAVALLIDVLARGAGVVQCPNRIELCRAPLEATFIWLNSEGKPARVDSYVAPNPDLHVDMNASGLRAPYPVVRITRIDASLVELAAELWRDTPAQRRSSENESTETLPGASAPVRRPAKAAQRVRTPRLCRMVSFLNLPKERDQ